MAEEAGVIGMNGIRLGIPLPSAALEIARFGLPAHHLTYVLYSGRLFKSDEAMKLGLVNEVVSDAQLLDSALARLKEFTEHIGNPAASLKMALRQSTVERINKDAAAMREAFLDVWFSSTAREKISMMRNELMAKRQRG
jgi:enoyl-CoA hydratase